MIEKMQYDNFGKFLRAKRNAEKISLNEFAFNNGIEPATLSRIETSKQDIKLSTLAKIANGFRQSPSELLREYEQSLLVP